MTYQTRVSPDLGALFPLALLPRDTIESLIEAALAELDRRDGDPDLEWEEDELAAARYGALDEGAGDDDDGEDTYDREWDEPDDPLAPLRVEFNPHVPVTNLFAGRAVEVRHG